MKMPRQGSPHIISGGRNFWAGTALALGCAWTTAHAATDCGAVTQIPVSECQSLMNLYTSTNGANWKDASTNNWNVTNTPCSWTGVVCSGGSVTGINRAGKGLAGPLPDLSALTGLQNLWLYSNALTGDMIILKNLTNLRVLSIGSTQLRGYPGDLATLTQLEELDLAYTPLATPMADLSSFKKLRKLNLTSTGMVGLIHPSLSALTNLESIILYNNQLVGNIPNLSALTKLSHLDLRINRLTGPIPDLNALTQLNTLWLSSNQLTGNIPDLSNLVRLGQAWFSSNQLSGNIPASLGALPAPGNIALGNNNLCIPGEPLLSQLNVKSISSDTTWATTQKSTNCGVTPPPAQFSLSVTASNGSISCNGTTCQTSYPTNTALTLVATPSAGYKFDSWGGACSGITATCQITLDAAKSVTANFSLEESDDDTDDDEIIIGNSGIWPSCGEHARYSIEDYTLIIPALEVPLLSFLGNALGESIYYETVLKQINGTNDRFVLQKITELVKVETDATCAKFDLDQGVATLPIVDVKLPVPGPLGDEDFGFYTEQYAVSLKWMPILGKEVFVIESINQIAE